MREKRRETCLQIRDTFAEIIEINFVFILMYYSIRGIYKLTCMLIHIPHWGGKEQPSRRNA